MLQIIDTTVFRDCSHRKKNK